MIPNPLAATAFSSRRGEALWEREGAGLGSPPASESGAASPWSVAADWHRGVRDLFFPVRLRVESVDV